MKSKDPDILKLRDILLINDIKENDNRIGYEELLSAHISRLMRGNLEEIIPLKNTKRLKSQITSLFGSDLSQLKIN